VVPNAVRRDVLEQIAELARLPWLFQNMFQNRAYATFRNTRSNEKGPFPGPSQWSVPGSNR
jgi:hypothetical protein